jgi:phage minor structural protein
MLRYKDKNGVESPLVKYENLYVEEVLDYGDKTLGFSIPKNLAGKIELENFIKTKTDEFVIKQMNTNDNGAYDIVAKINIDELEGASFQSFETVEQTALDAANLALAGTCWTCECTVKKKRTVRMTNSSAWDILKKIADTFILEMVIDSLNKKIIFKEKIGEDKGVYFTDELNLVSLTIQSNSSDFYTRILPLGKNGLTIESVNGGSKLLENHTYSQKNKTFIWKDERYTVPKSLKEDAIAKLEELATPYTSYSCKIVDLANAKKIKAYEYKIGDVITIINKETHIRIKQRIVKLKSYPENPGENTCEISNLKLTFSAYIQKYNSTCDTVDNITNDNGTVDGDAIDNIDASKVLNLDEIISKSGRFEALTTQIANVTGQLNANTAKIGTLENTKLSSAEADIKYATIEKLDGVEGKFEDFYAKDFESVVSRIEDLTVGVEKVNTIMFGSASGGSLTTEFSNSIVANIGDAQIKSAMIESIAADKITSGKIYTNLVEILSESGNLDITDNTIQIKDDNKVTRVQIGKDANSDYNMYVWDKSGNLMFDALGLTESGVKREIIRNDMIKENANIAASKLDIESLFNVINEDGSHTLKSSKIYVDANEQTLDVAFKNMTTNVTNLQNAVTTQGTQLTAVQGQISSKVWQQDINTTVNNLQIGGRNLFQNTGYTRGNLYLGWYQSTTTAHKDEIVADNATLSGKARKITYIEVGSQGAYIDIPASLKSKKNLQKKIYTQSCLLKANKAISVTWGNSSPGFNKSTVNVSTEWQKFEIKTTVVVNYVFSKITEFFVSNAAAGTELYIADYKFEEGEFATPWTPAPEDTDSAITTVSNQYTTLNQSLTSLTATVNSNTTAISKKADGSTVTALQANVTALTADLSGFKTSVSETYTSKKEFSDLQIGGRNLLLNTADLTKWTCEDKTTVAKDVDGFFKILTTQKTSWFSIYQTVTAVSAGQTYMLSGYNKKGTKAGYVVIRYYKSGTANILLQQNVSAGRFTIKFTVPAGADSKINVYLGLQPTASGDYTYFKLPKLEFGDKATDWTPAPEDTDEKFTEYSTTTQMNSAITQSANSVLTTVSSNYATKASLELKVDKDKLISEINASADVITLKSNRFVLDSTNAKIAADGTVNFIGGSIGGWKIDKHSLYSDYDKYRVYIQTVTGAEDWAFSVQEKKADGKYYANFLVDATGYVKISDGYLATKNHSVGGKGIEIFESQVKFYSWTDKDNFTGSIYTTYVDEGNSGSQNKRQSLVICSDYNDEIHLDYKDENRNPKKAIVIDKDADHKVHMIAPTVFHGDIDSTNGITCVSNFSVGRQGTERVSRFWCYNPNNGQTATNVRIFNAGGEAGTYKNDCELSIWGTGRVQYNWHVNGTIYGNVSSDSDRNVKKDIQALDIENSAQFIYSLIPSEFRFKNGTSNRLHHGLIAQEVKESMGDSDWGLFIDKKVDDENYNEIAINELTDEQTQLMTARYSLRYDELIADLIATVQSLNNRLKALEQ